MADESDITNEQIIALGRAAENAKAQFGEMSDEHKQATKNLTNAALAQHRNTKATKDNTASTKDATTASGAMAKGMYKVTTGTVAYATKLAEAASELRENRENFTSLNGSIELTGNAMKFAGKAVGAVGDGLGDLVSVLPLVGGVAGAFVSGVSKLAAAAMQAAGEIVNQVGPMLTAELQRASDAYRAAGAVGALGAEGLSGLGKQAVQAGLSFSTFSKVAAAGAEDLTFAFGDSATGVRRFADASEAMQPFRRGLLALGVSAESQNELTAKYIKLQAMQGNIEGRSARDLAQGSKNYITQLTALSRLTGKSVDEQQKAMDEQMRNVRMAAAVADVQSRLGEDAANAMKNTTAAITSMAPNIGKGLQDALSGNLGTEAAQEFQLAAGEMGAQAVDMLRKGTITQEEATAMIQEGVKKQAEAIGGPATIGAIAGLGTAFDKVLGEMLAMGQRTTLTATQIEGLGKAQENLKTTTDGTTAAMLSANESMLKSAQALDALALQTTLPLAAAGIEVFTAGMEKATTELLKYAGKTSEQIQAMLGKKPQDEIETGDVAVSALAGAGGGALAGAAAGAALGLIGGPLAPITSSLGAIAGALIGGTAGALGMGMSASEGFMPDWLDFDWGGGKAIGGDIKPRTAYMVGEQGPELLLSNMSGSILPNTAGPAGGYNSPDFGGAVSSNLAQTSAAGGALASGGAGGANNALMEASVNRLDQLVSAMSRNNDINTKILQAAHR